MIKLILASSLLFSCSSIDAKRDWYHCGPISEKQTWRFCDKRYDREDLHHKGLCYITEMCKKRVILKPKRKPHQLFCKWGDIPCLRENKALNKRILSIKL